MGCFVISTQKPRRILPCTPNRRWLSTTWDGSAQAEPATGPLTPLQEGLLFHALYDQSTPDVYTVQTALDLAGNIDAPRLKQACASLLQRHSNLRAAVVHEGLDQPVQVIPRSVRLNWREEDF